MNADRIAEHGLMTPEQIKELRESLTQAEEVTVSWWEGEHLRDEHWTTAAFIGALDAIERVRALCEPLWKRDDESTVNIFELLAALEGKSA